MKKQIFAIIDDEGRYANENSIFKDKQGKWHYKSEENYFGMWWKKTREATEKVIEVLEVKIHKIGLNRTFSIKVIG